MAKTKSECFKLVSTAGTGYFYTSRRYRQPNAPKLELKKYDPVARKRVVFKEKPIK